MAVEIKRLSSPKIEDYRLASEISEHHWSSMSTLDNDERFLFFQNIGIELIFAYEKGEIVGACFTWPVKYSIAGETFEWSWLFQLATVNAENAGALMLYHAMEWYPSIMVVGLTKRAAKLYNALGWQSYDSVWRCVRPIYLGRMASNYSERLGYVKHRALDLMSIFHDPLMAGLEKIFAYKKANRSVLHDPELCIPDIVPIHYPLKVRLNIMTKYLDVIHIGSKGKSLYAAIFGNIGRIVDDESSGLLRFRQHMTLWSELRDRKISFCEMFAGSKEAKNKNMQLGYIPFNMPIRYWQNSQDLSKFFENFHKINFSFFSIKYYAIA